MFPPWLPKRIWKPFFRFYLNSLRKPSAAGYLMRISIYKNNLTVAFSLLVLLALWKILSLLVDAAIIIPSPEETLKACFTLLVQPDFLARV